MAIIGIDLGTTNSLAACWKDGKPVVLKNSFGRFLTPSVISVDEDGQILCGDIAKERLVSHPDMSKGEFKRDMGTDTSYTLGGKAFDPVLLSSLVLKKIKEDAENELGEPVEEAVISVPAYFDDAKRFATKQAAELSGLKVERLINEPSAAALAFLQKNGFVDGTYMVIDFGGGTLDVSIIESFDEVMEILAVSGNNTLGGKDINEAIYKHFILSNEILEDNLTNEDKAVLYKLAEGCKIALSSMPISVMAATIGGKEYSLTMDNNKLITICRPILEEIVKPIKQVLRDSRLKIDSLQDIILVGGSCKMPIISAYIKKITGRMPSTDINPDTAIARGAAIFAGMKSRFSALREIVMTDICPFSLGTAITDRYTKAVRMDFIIPRNSMLPTSRTRSYSASSQGQDKLTIDIYQGESIIPQNNTRLGMLQMSCPPTAENDHICDITLTYDINGLLIVEVTTTDGVVHQKELVSRTNRMTKAQIETLKKQMDSMKFLARDQEQTRLLTARAERAIEESIGPEREILMRLFMEYKAANERGNGRDIRLAREALNKFLDGLDNYDTGLEE